MSSPEALRPLLVQAALSHLQLALLSVHEQVEALDGNERTTLIQAATSLQDWASDELLACPTLPLDCGAADVFTPSRMPHHGVVDTPCDWQLSPPPLTLSKVAVEVFDFEGSAAQSLRWNMLDTETAPSAEAAAAKCNGQVLEVWSSEPPCAKELCPGVEPREAIKNYVEECLNASDSSQTGSPLPTGSPTSSQRQEIAKIEERTNSKESTGLNSPRSPKNKQLQKLCSQEKMHDKHGPPPVHEMQERKMRTVLMLLDIVPAIIISLNALEIGMSSDLHPDSTLWLVCEYIWITCYTIEFLAKHLIIGWVGFWTGPDRTWNWFDTGCLSVSYIEIFLSLIVSSPGGGALGIMKMLRMARLARIVRALQYPMFKELKQMVLGVIAGVRVLFWAIVLLGVCIFCLAVAMRTLMGEEEEELRTVPHAMLTTFRCFTDGCSAYDGTPLPERLFESYGGVFMILYILAFMFITVGVFNLIMAILIDSVVTNRMSRELEELGNNHSYVEGRIAETIEDLLNMDKRHGEIKTSLHSMGQEAKKRIVVSRDKFHTWLMLPEMIGCLKDAGIEVSTKSELFDVLDVDMGGELTIDELTMGLMRLRGPITKTDVVAIRLKVRYLTGMIEEMYEEFRQMHEKVQMHLTETAKVHSEMRQGQVQWPSHGE